MKKEEISEVLEHIINPFNYSFYWDKTNPSGDEEHDTLNLLSKGLDADKYLPILADILSASSDITICTQFYKDSREYMEVHEYIENLKSKYKNNKEIVFKIEDETQGVWLSIYSHSKETDDIISDIRDEFKKFTWDKKYFRHNAICFYFKK